MVGFPISGILENEKYYGDILLQKTITVDFLKHKRVDNKGQAPKYYIEGNHEPIVSKEIFDKVQDEKERRALLRGNLVGDRHKYATNIHLVLRCFVGTAGTFLNDDSGTAPILQRKLSGSEHPYKAIH